MSCIVGLVAEIEFLKAKYLTDGSQSCLLSRMHPLGYSHSSTSQVCPVSCEAPVHSFTIISGSDKEVVLSVN